MIQAVRNFARQKHWSAGITQAFLSVNVVVYALAADVPYLQKYSCCVDGNRRTFELQKDHLKKIMRMNHYPFKNRISGPFKILSQKKFQQRFVTSDNIYQFFFVMFNTTFSSF